jgi:hypothetical protein
VRKKTEETRRKAQESSCWLSFVPKYKMSTDIRKEFGFLFGFFLWAKIVGRKVLKNEIFGNRRK